MRFQNRTILVTGGTSGIGLAAARAFLAEEANVVMAASGRIRGERAESLLREEYGERVRFFSMRCTQGRRDMQADGICRGDLWRS